MTSHAHYAAQQAAVDSTTPAPSGPTSRRPRPSGLATIGAFTGRWKAKRASQAVAHLYNDLDESRCGFIAKRSDILTRPPRWATQCVSCADPAYCPDCGDTAAAGHRADCCYSGCR